MSPSSLAVVIAGAVATLAASAGAGLGQERASAIGRVVIEDGGDGDALRLFIAARPLSFPIAVRAVIDPSDTRIDHSLARFSNSPDVPLWLAVAAMIAAVTVKVSRIPNAR